MSRDEQQMPETVYSLTTGLQATEISGRYSRSTMIEIGFAGDGRFLHSLGQSAWSLHVIADGACMDVPASAFWPWVAGLVGLVTPPLGAVTRILVDFDAVAMVPEDVEVTGLDVLWQGEDGEMRRATLTPTEFLDNLCRLAGREAS